VVHGQSSGGVFGGRSPQKLKLFLATWPWCTQHGPSGGGPVVTKYASTLGHPAVAHLGKLKWFSYATESFTISLLITLAPRALDPSFYLALGSRITATFVLCRCAIKVVSAGAVTAAGWSEGAGCLDIIIIMFYYAIMAARHTYSHTLKYIH